MWLGTHLRQQDEEQSSLSVSRQTHNTRVEPETREKSEEAQESGDDEHRPTLLPIQDDD